MSEKGNVRGRYLQRMTGGEEGSYNKARRKSRICAAKDEEKIDAPKAREREQRPFQRAERRQQRSVHRKLKREKAKKGAGRNSTSIRGHRERQRTSVQRRATDEARWWNPTNRVAQDGRGGPPGGLEDGSKREGDALGVPLGVGGVPRVPRAAPLFFASPVFPVACLCCYCCLTPAAR